MSKSNTILTLLQGCNSLQRLKKIHAHVIINGLQHHPAISNKLLNFCATSVAGSLSHAQLLFNQIQNPQTQAWNSLIRGFAQSPSPLQAIFCYNYMLLVSLSRPDTFTFSFTLKACERVKALNKCQELHGSVIKCGFETCVVVCTGVIRCYAANGLIETAGRGFHVEALGVYERMRNEKVGLDGFTLVGLLSACAHVGDYVLLATIYAASKDPEGVARMRKLMKSQGIKTTPGWSWIEVATTVIGTSNLNEKSGSAWGIKRRGLRVNQLLLI
ncbi:hypothetical protein Pint_21872 [Pistacia integerrima]|uniref:Uncharacterized protein n=1 Tax=Pistacia integerrima TaxID=434235 RepID=A0ACC0X942_9ROSI|nr:hypothetical protein Pint_21872 [Pistacia integerrima]